MPLVIEEVGERSSELVLPVGVDGDRSIDERFVEMGQRFLCEALTLVRGIYPKQAKRDLTIGRFDLDGVPVDDPGDYGSVVDFF